MMQTILLNALLCLGVIWMLLLIRYTYYYIQFSRRYDKQAQEQARVEQQKEEAHILVGKSKGLSSSDFPKVPETPTTADTPENANTFAPQESEEPDEEGEISEEENEMQIAFTADEVDEDEVVQEELPLSRDSMPRCRLRLSLPETSCVWDAGQRTMMSWGMYLLDCRSYDS